MEKNWGYLRNDRVSELMEQYRFSIKDLVKKLNALLNNAGMKEIEERTIRNWLKKEYEGKTQVQHAEFIAHILQVELKEVWEPAEKIEPEDYDTFTTKILSKKLLALGERDTLKVLFSSRKPFEYYYKSSVYTHFSWRNGRGIPWSNRQFKEYTYAFLKVTRSDGSGFSGINLRGEDAFHLSWSPPLTSNIVRLLIGRISVINDRVTGYQPWTRWDDEASLSDNGHIHIAFWLDFLPADFVLYCPNPEFDFKIEVIKPSDENPSFPTKIFSELAQLSKYSLTQIREHLNQIDDRNFIIFPKASQHKHEDD